MHISHPRNLIVIALSIAMTGPAAAAAAPSHSAPGKPASAAKAEVLREVHAEPASVVLDGSGAEQALLVTARTAAGDLTDRTAAAMYRSSNPRVVSVSRDGLLRSVGSGKASVEVRVAGLSTQVAVLARGANRVRPVSFRNDLLPVLGQAGCYQGTCHAKAGGKNGFQLSVLAFDPEADYAAIVRQAQGRRVNRLQPEKSLVLLKPTLSLPHGGGQRFRVGSSQYALMARWIAEGAHYGDTDPTLVRVEVLPAERTLRARRNQKLLVTAFYSDGTRRDVTRLSQFRSNESGIAEVSEDGIVRTADFGGEAAIMARFMGQVAVARISVPLNAGVPAGAYASLPRGNFVDELIYRKLGQLNVLPSAPCDDATFLRRASLDLIGVLPTPDETRAFLSECARETAGSSQPSAGGQPLLHPAARAALIDRLLARPEYADYWAMRWSSILLVNPDLLNARGAYAFDHWLRAAFRENMPYDRFVHEILTAAGDSYREGPPNFFRALPAPTDTGKAVSQLFLGVRIDCAQCHHHPFERWGQDDFYSLAAFFARVKDKSSYPEGYLSIIYNGDEGEVKHPKTERIMPPRPLGAPALEVPADEDRREYLARWMTAPENPYFARAIVNRTWAMLMGRGFVEPVDDFRVTNPATNEPLLDALAKDFVAHGYDLKHLLRTIALSAAYQRSSVTTPGNARDTQNYSRAYTRRLPAEVLLDAVGQLIGSPEKFNGLPEGTRAIQLWNSRMGVEFLDLFGRPGRQSVCECERSNEGSVSQALHLMNSDDLRYRLASQTGTAARLAASKHTPEEIVEELWLSAYCRPPTPEERAAALSAFTREKTDRRDVIQDLVWVLLNSPEFLLNH